MNLLSQPSSLRCVAAALSLPLALLAAAPASAETSPWYVGASQSLGYESNLYRIADEQQLPAGSSRSDSISITSLYGGIDQPIGRQRVYGSLNVGANRFANNKDLNNESYGLKLALDWETLERLSGTFRVAADQALTQFNNNNGVLGQVEVQKNLVNTEEAEARFQLGRKDTRIAFDASLGYRQRRYSAPSYDNSEFQESSGSLGVRYRPSGALEMGADIRQAMADFPYFRRTGISTYESDTRTRQYFDFTAYWVPSGISQLSLRVSPTHIWWDKNQVDDFRGLTGSADWNWQLSGKTRLHTVLWRDAGDSADAVSLGIYGPGVNDFSQVTSALRVRADHDLTGKVSLNASLTYAHRSLARTISADALGLLEQVTGSDNTTSAALGALWAVTRSGQLGCDVHNERRSSDNLLLSVPFNGYGFSCYGQITLQ